MNEMFIQLITAAASIVFGALIVSVPRWMKRNIAMPSRIEKLSRGMETLFRVNQNQNAVICSILSAINSILEAIRDGKVNGNITSAFKQTGDAAELMGSAEKTASEFLLKETMGNKVHD